MAAEQINRERQHSEVMWFLLMTTLGIIAVILRVISRLKVAWKLGCDDWMMIVGLFFTGSFVFEILYGLRFGMGLHGSDLTLPDMVALLKLVLTIQLTYPAAITAVKISILCFYIRLAAAHDLLRKMAQGSIIFMALNFFQTEMVTILQCLPTEKFWDLTGQVKGHCVNVEVFFYFVAALNVLLDIWVLMLPIKALKEIRLPTRDRVVLFIVFGFGTLACIASMVRLYTIQVFTASNDKFYDSVPINIWSIIEINLAIICASVPALKPLFTKSLRKRSAASRYNHNTSNTNYGRQIVPLSGGDKNNLSSFRNLRMDSNDYIEAGPSHGTSSQDHIMPPQDVTEV